MVRSLRNKVVAAPVTARTVRISWISSDLSVEGKIAWSVWHKAGVELSHPLAENDPVYIFLADQAAANE